LVKAFVDRGLHKIFSRKLFVFITSTVLMAQNSLASEDWTAIALVYIGSQAAVDIASRWRNGK
jgi:hypothetical protein